MSATSDESKEKSTTSDENKEKSTTSDENKEKEETTATNEKKEESIICIEDSFESAVNEEEEMTLIGNIEAYVLGDDFKLYKERLEHFLELNKITDDTPKINVLASFGGADLYKVLYSLTQPKKVTEHKYEELITKLETHFAPKRNIVAESFKFNKRDQKQGETIAEYIVELKTMAQSCDFGNFLDRALRDRFICGVSNESIQRRLFNDSELKTFEKACDAALMMETTKSDMEFIHSGATNFVGKGSFQGHTASKSKSDAKPSYGKSNGDGQRSNNGGRGTFTPGDRRVVCFACGHAGHISRFCERRKQQSKGKSSNFSKDKSKNYSTVHNLKETCSFDYQYLNSLHSMYINRLNGGALTTLVNINGKEVRMEIDTGASGTVIHIDRLKELFPNLKLSDSRRNFKLLTGESVDVLGCAYVSVEHNKKRFDLELTVVNASTGVLPLFGQDWLDVFYPGWREFFTTFHESEEKVNLLKHFDANKYKNELRAKYKNVFSGDMCV